MRTLVLRLRPLAVLIPLLALAPGFAHAQPPPGSGPPPRIEQRDRVRIREHGPGGIAPFDRIIPMGRGYVGLELLDLTPELRAHFGVPEGAGVMVAKVAKDSPAADAGLAVGDIITAIEGKDVKSSFDLAREVRPHEANETVAIEAFRDGHSKSFTVTVRERDRREVDVGGVFGWQAEGDEEHPRLFFMGGGDGEHGEHHRGPHPMALERLGSRLEGLDWDRLVADPERTAQLEKRLAELEKRLAELKQRLEEATRERR